MSELSTRFTHCTLMSAFLQLPPHLCLVLGLNTNAHRGFRFGLKANSSPIHGEPIRDWKMETERQALTPQHDAPRNGNGRNKFSRRSYEHGRMPV